MKRYLVIALFGTAFAVAAGLIGLHGISATPLLVAQSANTENTGIFGHVTYTVTAPNGQVKQYLQTDNMVMNKGKNCAAVVLFLSNSTANGCTATQTLSGTPDTTSGFNWIAIGNATNSIGAGNTTLPTGPNSGGGELQRLQALPTFTISSGGSSSSAGSSAIVALQQTFSFTATKTITNSGLFDKSSGSNEFAAQNISPTVAVNNGDSLTVKWTVNVG